MDHNTVDVSSTTLVTFHYQNLQAYTVELLGSWDNFSRAYPMRLDARRGGDQWTGCYSFGDIASDGDKSSASGVRSGGLRMGGTYWYYYSLNGGMAETHDATEPCTTSCPLLPGQCVNILDVPYESSDANSTRFTSVSSAVQTLDPQDRYINPRPAPVPKPSLPRLVTSERTHSGTQADKTRMQRSLQYPATAGGYPPRNPENRPGHVRRLHTATSSPNAAVTNAFTLTKSLDAATCPDQDGRDRTRTLSSTHGRCSPSSPSSEEARVSPCGLHLNTDRSRGDVPQSNSLSATGCFPNKSTSHSKSFGPDQMRTSRSKPSQERRSPTDSIQNRAIYDHSNPSIRIIAAPFQGRSISLERAGRLLHTSPSSTSSESRSLSRSSSEQHAATPLRSISTSYDSDDNAWARMREQKPVSSQECLRDDGDSEYVSRSAQPRSVSSGSTSNQSSLDKELPPLPSYLIPEPLKIRPRKDDRNASAIICTTATPEPRQSQYSTYPVNESRFSEWTTSSVDHENPSDFDEDESEDQMSPTLSSIHGESLVAMTPRRLSDTWPRSLDDTVQVWGEADETDSLDQSLRLDIATLLQLRAAIESSSLPSHNTYRPQPRSPYMSKPRERVLEGDGASSLGDMTPTATTLKVHETLRPAREPLVAGDSVMEELLSEFDYLGGFLS